MFHDVSFGDMDVDCQPLTDPATGAVIGTFNCYKPSGANGVMSRVNDKYEPTYPAKPGYDFASGIGSDVFTLVKARPGETAVTTAGSVSVDVAIESSTTLAR